MLEEYVTEAAMSGLERKFQGLLRCKRKSSPHDDAGKIAHGSG